MKKKFHNVTLPMMLFLLGTTLVLFLGSILLLYQWLKISRERDLGEKLAAIGKTAANTFSSSDLLILDISIIDNLKDSPAMERIVSNLLRIKKENELRSILLIDTKGRIILDPDDEYQTGENYQKITVDQSAWENALAGLPGISEYYSAKDSPYKNAYIPLKNDEEKVMAVLQIEASRKYFASIYELYRYLILICIVIVAVLVLVALNINRMVRKLLFAEEAVAVADRFQAIGSMTAGIAHELRNPLCIIRNTTEVIKKEISDEEMKMLSDDILEEVKRMNDLLTQFLHLSKDTHTILNIQTVDLNDRLDSLIKVMQKGLPDDQIKLRKNIRLPDGEKTLVLVDDNCLRQALVNLIINAKDAMKNKNGYIDISVSCKKDKILISVADQGEGIKESDIQKVFDPFFTTRDTGTGLGLSITKRLIEDMGGEIYIESESGKGTTVSFTLLKANSNEEK